MAKLNVIAMALHYWRLNAHGLTEIWLWANISGMDGSCLYLDGNVIYFIKAHEYFHQFQCQMFATNRNYCDLLLCTTIHEKRGAKSWHFIRAVNSTWNIFTRTEKYFAYWKASETNSKSLGYYSMWARKRKNWPWSFWFWSRLYYIIINYCRIMFKKSLLCYGLKILSY